MRHGRLGRKPRVEIVQRSVPLQHTPIHIDDWSGVVLSSPCVSDVTRRAIPEPTVSGWTQWLRLLIEKQAGIPGGKVLKTSNNVEVVQAYLPANDDNIAVSVVAKQIRTGSILDSLRSTPAKRNFDRGLRLRDSGIATALPLALLEKRSPRASWLITEFLDTVMDLDTLVLRELSRLDTRWDRKRRSGLARALAQVFHNLECAGLYHRDMKASNILITQGSDNELPRACIVDLDGLARMWPWRSRWKPLVRFAASLLQYESVTTTDYARFLKEYLSVRGEDPASWPAHFRRLRKQAARYSQAARSRKIDKLDRF